MSIPAPDQTTISYLSSFGVAIFALLKNWRVCGSFSDFTLVSANSVICRGNPKKLRAVVYSEVKNSPLRILPEVYFHSTQNLLLFSCFFPISFISTRATTSCMPKSSFASPKLCCSVISALQYAMAYFMNFNSLFFKRESSIAYSYKFCENVCACEVNE